ncbi:MAG: lactonase family protein [Actinomycetales bacterium]
MKLNLARTLGLAAVAALAVPVTAATSAGAATGSSAKQLVGHVYEATNVAGPNAVQVFDRYADGHLAAHGTVATGGRGAGASLHSQGGLVRSGSLLLVVNGGDDTVSSLAITSNGLRLRSVVPSGGDLPVSVTAYGHTAYVLNQGDSTISGFRIGANGKLQVLPRSTRHLRTSGGTADAAQVSFQPNGRHLVVTERATNAIEVFPVAGGYAGAATSTPSAGVTPYGFDFDRHGDLLVSEAAGSASSYRLGDRLHVISPAVSDTQAAPCWLVTTPQGGWAFVVNSASASISSYRVGSDGALTLVAAAAATTGAGSAPTDATISPSGRILSVRLGSGAVASYGIGTGGALTGTGTASGLAAVGSAGLASD